MSKYLSLCILIMGMALILPACSSDNGNEPVCDSVQIILGLDRRDGDLASFVDQVSTPDSSSYGQYLSMEEIADRFGASSEVLQAVLEYLEERGIYGAEVGPTGSTITCKACVETAERLFCYKPEAESQASCVPTELQGKVQEVLITELLSEQTVESLHTRIKPTDGGSCGERTGTPEGCKGAIDTEAFTLNQWLAAYGIDKLHAKGIRGEGIRVAILNGAPWHLEALETWLECFSIPTPNIHLVQLPFLKPFSYAEAELDIELIMGVAPRLDRITTFSGVSNIGPSLVYGYAAMLDASLMDGTLPHVISSSGGECETTSFSNEEIRLLEHFFMAGSAAGITYVLSSGDAGFLGDCNSEQPGTNYPTSSHYVTGVGGTSMTLTSSNEIEDQTVWNDDSGSSGGGPSSIFLRPDWQGGPLFDPFSGYERLTPDVAFFASETHPGYAIYAPLTFGPFDKPNNLGWRLGGGTSASAPLFAGIVALLNQQLIEAGKTTLGCFNPLLYAMASDPEQYNKLFWDVTEGTSGGDTVRTGKAAEFYDLATGLGSLKVDAVAEYLKTHPPGS
jgi:kumamolisin